MVNSKIAIADPSPAQVAFSRQAEHYDEDDFSNEILTAWREQVYETIELFIRPCSRILELNSGTGIDALHFARQGHCVHATDHAPGMITKINQKIFRHDLLGKVTSQQCSFEKLGEVREKKFDYVFSNFGGLNCCRDLTEVAEHLPPLLNPGAYVTWVIMPPISFWELAWLFKGKPAALRRLKRNGTTAHLEGEFFRTYYHSLSDIRRALGSDFRFVKCESLGIVSPPPASIGFFRKHPRIVALLKKADRFLRNRYPFNRCGDHIIVTFQYMNNEDQR